MFIYLGGNPIGIPHILNMERQGLHMIRQESHKLNNILQPKIVDFIYFFYILHNFAFSFKIHNIIMQKSMSIAL